MRRRRTVPASTAAAAALALSASVLSGTAAPAADRSPTAPASAPLDAYRAEVTSAEAAELARAGMDIAHHRAAPDAGKLELDLVLTAAEARALRQRGIDVRLKRLRNGKTVRQLARAQAAAGFRVFRPWDGDGGVREQLHELAAANPGLVKLVVLGRTHQGREIIALKVTADARKLKDGARPAVLYNATQHAREWIATETGLRLLKHAITEWRHADPAWQRLLRSRELWFVPVNNPDGYQYTFDHERLWRKNLRDNDGDGRIGPGDGVDPNRNYPEHFNYDREGSSGQPASEVYRGPAAGSEPETQAMMRLFDRVRFAFAVNFHSYGPYLLYPEGWQVGTPSPDDPVYYALSGNLDRPAIPDSHPGLGADVLYATNGDFTDWAYRARKTLSWTPELEEGCDGCGFVFPDDEALVQQQFEKVLPFALDVARAAAAPSRPSSHLGLRTKPFYLRSDDAYKAGLPLADLAFTTSHGRSQQVRVLARRTLRDVRLRYRVDGGPVRVARVAPWRGGQRYGDGRGVHYEVLAGTATGVRPGGEVTAWFTGREGGRQVRSESFTYQVRRPARSVLIVAAEDYTGASPAGTTDEPRYLRYYTEALARLGIRYDVYDVDAERRRAPDALGVLGHYDAVIWYTGDDNVTRRAGWGAGNASRLAADLMLEMREYLNQGGRVLLTGKNAGHQYTVAHGLQQYDPTDADEPCIAEPGAEPLARCRVLAGTGDSLNDVLQYWFGTGYLVEDGGTDPASHTVFDVAGTAAPLTGGSWSFGASGGAGNADHSASFLPLSALLPEREYPQFTSSVAAKYERPGGPFEPHHGSAYAYSQIADQSYKRLTRTLSVPAEGGSLSFWMSRDVELDWDFVAVEARAPGQDDWTTLPDALGHTSTAVGSSCAEGWHDIHPHLAHYQTFDGSACTPTGTTGAWHAATGPSGGWQQWRIDLADYAGKEVEISISYVSDWASQGLGVFVDHIMSTTGEGSTSFEPDDDPLDGWVARGEDTSAANLNNWTAIGAAGFPEGPVVVTGQTVYAGFGLESIDDREARVDFLRRSLRHLLR